MPLNTSGPISLAGSTVGQSIAVELGLSATGTISLNQTNVRTLAGVPSGAITMPTNFYGKANRVSISHTFTTSTVNASLNISSISGYSTGTSDITVTVNGGVYLWANSTGSYGLNLTGGASGDTLTLVNNGLIIGQGGGGSSLQNGGPALNIGTAINITINNTNGSAYIAGGGAGGSSSGFFNGGFGGGAGGGQGGTGESRAGPGGAGGGIGSSGNNGGVWTCPCDAYQFGSGGGGGRILPGTGGAAGTSGSAAGRGGGAGGGGGGTGYGGQNAGAGGSANNAGGNAVGSPGSGGGGWGAAAGNGNGTGGKAVNLNGRTVTWVSGNTTRVWGAVS